MKHSKVTSTICLDTRRPKKNGEFPVKLRITFKRKSKLYKTPYSLINDDFILVTEGKLKPKSKLKDIKLDLANIESDVLVLIESLPTFSFDLFESKYKSDTGDSADLFYQFKSKIKQLNIDERMGSASAYTCAYNSFKKYHPRTTLDILSITPQFLKNYEKWMTTKGNSLTTVGIYLRCVRHLINEAINENAVSKDHYPFGRNKYTIPKPKNIKKALSIGELKLLYEYKTEKGSSEQMYRDLWFFSYLCNGMNIKDICLLQHKNIDDKHIYFYRKKTIYSNRDSKPVDVFIIDDIRAILNRWANKPNNPENFVFPFITHDMDARKVMATVKQVTKMTNKYIWQIAKKVGIHKKVTTYWARHSYATVLKRSNAGIAFISEQMGHKNLKTTESYLDSFEDDTKKEFANKLLDFS